MPILDSGAISDISSQFENAIYGVLIHGKIAHFDHLIKDENNIAALSHPQKGSRRSPLYNVIGDILRKDEINVSNAPRIASRLHDVLRTVEVKFGENEVNKAVNTLSLKRITEDDGFETETLRELIERHKEVAPAFHDVFRRFQLLSRKEVLETRLPFAQRVTDEELNKIRLR